MPRIICNSNLYALILLPDLSWMLNGESKTCLLEAAPLILSTWVVECGAKTQINIRHLM